MESLGFSQWKRIDWIIETIKMESHDGIVHSFAFLIEESSEVIDKVKWITPSTPASFSQQMANSQ